MAPALRHVTGSCTTTNAASAKDADRKTPTERGHIKNIKKCQKCFRHFSTCSRRAKSVKKCRKYFWHFSAVFARHQFSAPFWGALTKDALRPRVLYLLVTWPCVGWSFFKKRTKKRGFGQSGFLQSPVSRPSEQKNNQGYWASSTLGTQSTTVKRGVHCCKNPLLKTPCSWLMKSGKNVEKGWQIHCDMKVFAIGSSHLSLCC